MKNILCTILVVVVAYLGYSHIQDSLQDKYDQDSAGYEAGSEEEFDSYDYLKGDVSRSPDDPYEAAYGIYNEVMTTPTGECFHKINCYTVDDSEDKMATTREDAIEHGYRPCEVCNP